MSRFSGTGPCPNCGGEIHTYCDKKPFGYYHHTCLRCGLVIYPVVEYLDIIDLNNKRKEYGMKKLKKLPKQIFTG